MSAFSSQNACCLMTNSCSLLLPSSEHLVHDFHFQCTHLPLFPVLLCDILWPCVSPDLATLVIPSLGDRSYDSNEGSESANSQGAGEGPGTQEHSRGQEDSELDSGPPNGNDCSDHTEDSEQDGGGDTEEDTDYPDTGDVYRGLAAAQLLAYNRALEDSWEGAFADARSAIEDDHTVLVTGSVSELHEKLRRPVQDGHPMSVGDYCVTQLHIREVSFVFFYCTFCKTYVSRIARHDILCAGSPRPLFYALCAGKETVVLCFDSHAEGQQGCSGGTT